MLTSDVLLGIDGGKYVAHRFDVRVGPTEGGVDKGLLIASYTQSGNRLSAVITIADSG